MIMKWEYSQLRLRGRNSVEKSRDSGGMRNFLTERLHAVATGIILTQTCYSDQSFYVTQKEAKRVQLILKIYMSSRS